MVGTRVMGLGDKMVKQRRSCFMILVDRYNVRHTIKAMLLKDVKTISSSLEKNFNILMTRSLLPQNYHYSYRYTLEESHNALQEWMQKCFTDIKGVDLAIAKLAMIKYLGLGVDTLEKITAGTTIEDRHGKQHIAYSYLLSEYMEALELLQKVDTVSTAGNLETEDAYEAMLEIVYRALNERETKEEINEYIDAEFARKAIRIYFDLPLRD